MRPVYFFLLLIPTLLLSVGCASKKAASIADRVEAAELKIFDASNPRPLNDTEKAQVHLRFAQYKAEKEPISVAVAAIEDGQTVSSHYHGKYNVSATERYHDSALQLLQSMQQMASLAPKIDPETQKALDFQTKAVQEAAAKLEKAKALQPEIEAFDATLTNLSTEAASLR